MMLGDARAYLAMLAEHQRLSVELAGRAAAVSGMVLAGLPHDAALAGFVSCLNEDVLPYAAAEEEILYPVAVRAGLIGAVAELAAEHDALTAAAARLAEEAAGPAASRAREIVALFTAHMDREDGVLLEALLGENDASRLQTVVPLTDRGGAAGSRGRPCRRGPGART